MPTDLFPIPGHDRCVSLYTSEFYVSGEAKLMKDMQTKSAFLVIGPPYENDRCLKAVIKIPVRFCPHCKGHLG